MAPSSSEISLRSTAQAITDRTPPQAVTKAPSGNSSSLRLLRSTSYPPETPSHDDGPSTPADTPIGSKGVRSPADEVIPLIVSEQSFEQRHQVIDHDRQVVFVPEPDGDMIPR